MSPTKKTSYIEKSELYCRLQGPFKVCSSDLQYQGLFIGLKIRRERTPFPSLLAPLSPIVQPRHRRHHLSPSQNFAMAISEKGFFAQKALGSSPIKQITQLHIFKPGSYPFRVGRHSLLCTVCIAAKACGD